jgi:uncharacterized membrane protein
LTSHSQGPSRRAYIDWARGIAVLLMIEAHTFDAWTRVADRNTLGFRNASILGGFAAPLFLWLAGVSVALAAPRAARRAGDRRWNGAEAVCRRGIEIFILAFVFRLQAFIVSPGNAVISLFRVDILNVMGPAIAAAALVWAVSGSTITLAFIYGAIATAIAMATPLVRAAPAIGKLPTWLQWYVRPAGEHTTFTLFPWAGFVFAGAAVGVLIAASAARGGSENDSSQAGAAHESRLLLAIGASGIAILVLGLYTATRPALYASSSFWTSSPTYFAVRVGIMMIALAALFGVEGVASRDAVPFWSGPLAALGRHSLFVYWIHVELVYGYTSWFWRKSLPLWGTTIAFATFCALMYGAVMIRNRVAGRPRPRPHVGPATATAA